MKPAARIVSFVAFATALTAQTASPTPAMLGDLNVTASLRSRVYFWDWFQPTSGNNNYQYSGNLFRIGLSQSHGSWDWNAEFGVPFLLGLPAGATGSGPQQG